MRRSRRWFERLLRFFPEGFRARHGADMGDAFENGWADHRAAGRGPLLGFVARTVLNMASAGIRERLRGRREGLRGHHGRRGIVSWLDVKLGWRMLWKHPGLAIVSLFALSVGIPVGLAPALFVDGLLAPLPVPDGDRIRALRVWSPALGRTASTTLLDYETWRESLESFESLGAVRSGTQSIGGEHGGGRVRSAEVTRSALELLRVRPELGRLFRPEDATAGAERVVLIGHDAWQSRFGSDANVIGTSVRLGGVPHTVVGVMPEGFFFPEREVAWTPLRATAASESTVDVSIFGRLANGVSDDEALSEFTSVALRNPSPETSPEYERDPLQPQIGPFALTRLSGLSGSLRSTPEFIAFQALALIVLLVACANVGMLVFARTAARAGDLSVRTALGASRSRLVTQVFTEALVLAVIASGVGLLLITAAIDVVWRIVPAEWSGSMPYWIDWRVTPRTALQALALALLSAVAAGVIPAVRFTGRSVQSNIQRAAARRTGVRFGGLSSILIVCDVAIAVAAVGFAATATQILHDRDRMSAGVGIPAEEFLAATVTLPSAGAAAGQSQGDDDERSLRMAMSQEALVARLRAEPGVRTVAVANTLPRMEHAPRRVEAEGVDPEDGSLGVSSRTAQVQIDYFESLGQSILAGRDFNVGDLDEAQATVIVNSTFVERVLGGQNPIGRRIRFHPWGNGEPGPWKEIVGVVGHLGMRVVSPDSDQGVYEPFAPGELSRVHLGIRIGDDPASFAPRLREIMTEVDPELGLSVIGSLDDVYEGDWYLTLAATYGAALLVGVLLALAASGIYAIMSFSVSERTAELGIRAALGAGQRDLAKSVATRAIAQLAAGVLLGMPFAAAFFRSESGSFLAGAASTIVVGVVILTTVALAACTGPTLRALRVPPSRALRGEG